MRTPTPHLTPNDYDYVPPARPTPGGVAVAIMAMAEKHVHAGFVRAFHREPAEGLDNERYHALLVVVASTGLDAWLSTHSLTKVEAVVRRVARQPIYRGHRDAP
jgi:hypothetical protein